jgi:hypothetical protein
MNDLESAQVQPIKRGMHAEHFGGDSPAVEAKSISRILLDTGVFSFLSRHPIDSVLLLKQTTRGGKPSNSSGFYEVQPDGETQLQVKIPRKEGAFGRSWNPGELFSVAMAGETNQDACARMMLHLIAHHAFAYASAKDDSLSAKVQDAFNDRAEPCFSQYAERGPVEFLSEALVAYQFHAEELHVHDPNTYQLAHEFTKRFHFGHPNTGAE